jgi:hypothetical protein
MEFLNHLCELKERLIAVGCIGSGVLLPTKCEQCEGTSYLPGPEKQTKTCWACVSENADAISRFAQEQVRLFNIESGEEDPNYEEETSDELIKCHQCKDESIPKWFAETDLGQGMCLSCLGRCGCGEVTPKWILEEKGSCVNCDIRRFSLERKIDADN